MILLLVAVLKVLHNMNTAQRKWVSLEPYQEQMKLKQNTGGFNYREVAKLLTFYMMTELPLRCSNASMMTLD